MTQLAATERDLAALDALLEVEDCDFQSAAHRIGIAEGTCRARIRRLRERTGMSTERLLVERDRELRKAA